MGTVASEQAPKCCCGSCCPGKLCDDWECSAMESVWSGNLYFRISNPAEGSCDIFNNASGVLTPPSLGANEWVGNLPSPWQDRQIRVYCSPGSELIGWRSYGLEMDLLWGDLCYFGISPAPISGSCKPFELVFEAVWHDTHTDPEDPCEYSPACAEGEKLTITISCQPQSSSSSM